MRDVIFDTDLEASALNAPGDGSLPEDRASGAASSARSSSDARSEAMRTVTALDTASEAMRTATTFDTASADDASTGPGVEAPANDAPASDGRAAAEPLGPATPAPVPPGGSVARDDAGRRSAREPALARALAAVREAVTVATLLRTLGAAAIVGSLSLYLLQGFDVRGDLSRVFTLLGQSALLALAGLAVGVALREPKGARVFLALALVSVPANFAVLGAMLYSIAPLDGGLLPAHFPAFATWRAETSVDAWRAVGAGAALLLPITAFGFAVLARRHATTLSLALLAGSALLLVPVRAPSVTIVAAGAMLIGAVIVTVRAGRRAAARGLPMTFEERLAHGLLFLPAALVLARTMLANGLALDSALPLAMAAFYGFDRLVAHARGTVRRQRVVALLGAVAGVATAVLAVPLLDGTLPGAALLLVFAAVSGALSWRLMRSTDEPGARRAVGALWSGLSLAAVCASVAVDPSAVGSGGGSTLAGVVVTLAVVLHGVLEGRLRRAVLGGAVLVGLAWLHADVLVSLVLGGGWRALAGLGVGTIVAGSLLERFGPALRLGLERRRQARAKAADDPTTTPSFARADAA